MVYTDLYLSPGVYSAVQIKSNSVQAHAPYRWCSAPSGERLPGREKDRGLGVAGETDMTCACSQKRWELEQGKVRNIKGFNRKFIYCTYFLAEMGG